MQCGDLRRGGAARAKATQTEEPRQTLCVRFSRLTPITIAAGGNDAGDGAAFRRAIRPMTHGGQAARCLMLPPTEK